MPYASIKELVKKRPNLKKYSAKAKKVFLGAFNSVMEKDSDEGKAFKIAYAAANKIDGKESINECKTFAEYYASFKEKGNDDEQV